MEQNNDNNETQRIFSELQTQISNILALDKRLIQNLAPTINGKAINLSLCLKTALIAYKTTLELFGQQENSWKYDLSTPVAVENQVQPEQYTVSGKGQQFKNPIASSHVSGESVDNLSSTTCQLLKSADNISKQLNFKIETVQKFGTAQKFREELDDSPKKCDQFVEICEKQIVTNSDSNQSDESTQDQIQFEIQGQQMIFNTEAKTNEIEILNFRDPDYNNYYSTRTPIEKRDNISQTCYSEYFDFWKDFDECIEHHKGQNLRTIDTGMCMGMGYQFDLERDTNEIQMQNRFSLLEYLDVTDV